MRKLISLILLCVSACAGASIEEKTAGMRKLSGLFPLYWEEKGGNLFLEIERMGEEFLFYTSLTRGLGSNDIGLDRNQLGNERILHFRRVGTKVLLQENNLRYRAESNDAAERAAVASAFASSTHFGFTVAAETGARVLVDFTPFVLRDGHRAAERIKNARSGTYRVDAARSVVEIGQTKNFPANTEVEVSLTFAGEPQGRFVASVAPDAESVTLGEHYSFVQLPGPGYKPRAFDPRSSFIPTQYRDYAAPLGEPMDKRWIVRHRLHKKDPTASVSEPVRPITYYLDPATPEPVRSALLEGARWWDQAFAAAGFRGAFRVEMLPAGADPMDIRYNMIHWVHRSTRGWSYGSSVMDPRTGEILKGNVTLGSLRVRQDYMIAEGLLAPYEAGKPANTAMREMALARLRQLSAHEVGHTIGLTHNFASSISNRASVMDYPHPLVTLTSSGGVDMAASYASGIGEWDKVAIAFGYQDFAPGVNEPVELDKLMRAAYARGLRFLSDEEARDPSGSSPVAHLWDNGADAASELARILTLRRAVIGRFGEANLQMGQPMSTLRGVLVPMFLLHRYQVEAASKLLAGVDYNYALRGDGQVVTRIVPAADQRRALGELLKTLDAAELEIPERVLSLLPPVSYGYQETREEFASRTGRTFDPVAAAESSANHTLSLLLDAGRAARLDQLKARDAVQPGLREVLESLLTATWRAPRRPGMRGEIQKAVDWATLHHLMALAANESASAGSRAEAHGAISSIRRLARLPRPASDAWAAYYAFADSQIERFLRDPKVNPIPRPLAPPPGQPIGCGSEGWL